MIQENQKSYIDIENFFTMNLGSWLGQKTSYNPSSKKHTTSTAKTSIRKVDNSKQKSNLLSESNNQLYAIKSQKKNNIGDSMVEYIQEKSSGCRGVVYKFSKNNKNRVAKGQFKLSDGILKISINKDSLAIEETIWFVNQNVKLTKSITKKNNQCVLISFSSEIKLESTK